MASETREIDEQELVEQIETATQMVQKAVGQMLRTDDIHPHVVVLAVARVAGELMGALAAESGHDLDEVLRDSTEVVHQAARNHHEAMQTIKAELMLVAGNA